MLNRILRWGPVRALLRRHSPFWAYHVAMKDGNQVVFVTARNCEDHDCIADYLADVWGTHVKGHHILRFHKVPANGHPYYL